MPTHGKTVWRNAAASGPGSLKCESEIRALIHGGHRREAIELYERDRDLNFRAGENRGIPRLAYWYSLAKVNDPRAQ